MDEQTNIGFIVRARILPHIEGSEELKQSVENLATNIQQRMQQTTSSPAFTEGMKPEEQRKVEQFTSMKDMAEVQKFQERQREILEQLDEEAGAGALSGKQRRTYQKEFKRQKKDIQEIQERLIERLDEPEFEFLPPEKKEVLRTSIMEGAQESLGQLDELNEKLQTVFDNLEKVRRAMRVPGRLEGAEELKRSIDEISEGIQDRLQRAVSSKKFREGLDPETIERAEQFAKTKIDNTVGEQQRPEGTEERRVKRTPIEDEIEERREPEERKSERRTYEEEYEDKRGELTKLKRQMISQVEEEFGDLDEEKKQILIKAVTEGVDDALDEINQLRDKVEDFSKFGQTPLKLSVLPDIEGAEELKRSLESLTGNVRERVQQTISSQAFVEGMDEKDIRKMEHFAGMEDMLEVQKFQERQREILEELDIDASAGRLTVAQRKKYIKKFGRQRQELEGLQENLLSQIDEGYFDFLEPEKKQILRTAIIEGTEEAIDQVDDLSRKFETVADNIEKAQTNAKGLYEQLKELSVIGIVGMAGREAANFIRAGYEIEAKERTSFDLTSPMGMYSQQRQYELFKETRERSREFSAGGMLAGAGAGIAAAALTGGAAIPLMLGGAFAGQFAGSEIASWMNIEATGKTEEELKFLQQSLSVLSESVGAAQTYDILRARTRARAGEEALGSLNLGYAPEQELQMRMSFTDAFGRFDERLYEQQTTFARAKGLDPNELYKLNTTARMTGMDVGILGLSEADRMAQITYGQDFGSQRIVDILNDIKNINEQMLKVNIDGDTRDALSLTRLPELLFGVDSPYGRMGELGGTTIRMLEDLMRPKSLAHEAFLYTSLGTPNIMEFTEEMKGGIYSGDNLLKIMENIRDYAGDNEFITRAVLNEMLPSVPKGFIPEIAKVISGEGNLIRRNKIEGYDEKGNIIFAKDENQKIITEEVYQTLKGVREEQEEYRKKINDLKLEKGKELEVIEKTNLALLGFSEQAQGAKSQSETFIEQLRKLQNDIADQWRGTVVGMQKDWLSNWEEISSTTKTRVKLESDLNDVLTTSIEKLKERLDPETFYTNINEEFRQILSDKEKEARGLINQTPNYFSNSENIGKEGEQNNINWNDTLNNLNRSIEDMNITNRELINQTPREIRVIIEDRTSNGIDSTVRDANSEFRF